MWVILAAAPIIVSGRREHMSGFRFRKSLQLLPGVRLNISKKGASLSLGPKGAHITTGTSGTFFSLDLPGSGAYYRKKLDTKNGDSKAKPSKKSSEAEAETQDADSVPEKLDLGLMQRLTIPTDEIALVEALKALAVGDEAKALDEARKSYLADSAFIAGFLLFKRGDWNAAASAFSEALKNAANLDKHIEKYDLDFAVTLPITEAISIQIEPNAEGALLALAECQQNLGLTEVAIESLKKLYEQHPDDLIARLSLAEVLSDAYPDSQPVQQQVVNLAADTHNESPVHAALMYYRARALRRLGLIDGAKDTLAKALKRTKGYPDDLLRALRYERAVVYDLTGDPKKAQAEFQKIYAEAPSYEDVAARLGL
jgi:tetratricopeptide (TPR) repeat protein